jgi:hypothetical protein
VAQTVLLIAASWPVIRSFVNVVIISTVAAGSDIRLHQPLEDPQSHGEATESTSGDGGRAFG